MARLSVSLLGSFDVSLEGRRITAFKADKARALLAYLITEADRPHHRESLAALLWPEYPEASARNNLRQTLYRVRQVLVDDEIASPHLLITPRDIQFNPASDYWLDVDAFRGRTTDFLHGCSQSRIPSDADLGEVETVIDLYRGDFLAGFSIEKAPQFEDWLLSHQESLHHLALETLAQLADHLERRRKFTASIRFAKRAVELEPWFEVSHRQLIRLLALSGQRHAALNQYEECRRHLDRELGLAPSPETNRLVDRIRDGSLLNLAERGPFLGHQKRGMLALQTNVPFFVARENELEQLERHLQSALSGQGHLVFLRGEAGSGKTALMIEAARRGLERHENLLAAAGGCGALTDQGRPFLPFFEILRMLSGDEDCLRLSGLPPDLTSPRLISAFPDILQVLLEESPDLLCQLAPPETFLKRALRYHEQSENRMLQLKELVIHPEPPRAWMPSEPGLEQTQPPGLWPMAIPSESGMTGVYDQIAHVVISLSHRWPLLLILDDLHWADQSSLNLLFHMVRLISCHPILMVCAYRPENIVPGISLVRHPLGQVIYELKRRIGEAELDLSKTDGRHFIDALLDKEPNRLDKSFRETLYQHTEGMPLLTAELLSALQESGDLHHDEEGHWISNPILAWEHLPPRAEAILAERVHRVSELAQDILFAACVQGMTFCAEVIAKVLGSPAKVITRTLSHELIKMHQLVQLLGVEQRGDRSLSLYQFRNRLQLLYFQENLDRIQQTQLQRITAEVMEEMFGGLLHGILPDWPKAQ